MTLYRDTDTGFIYSLKDILAMFEATAPDEFGARNWEEALSDAVAYGWYEIVNN